MSELQYEATVLVVDDMPLNLTLVSDVLRDLYNVRAVTNGPKALQIARSNNPPDLILLDISMPGMDGYEVCRQLKEDAVTKAIPVIFLTAMTDVQAEEKGFALEAVDYIAKPITPATLLARVKTHITLKASADFLRDKATFLEQEVLRRTDEMRAIQDITILMLASLAETRDNETGNHILRTQHYVRLLAEQLRHHPRFNHFLTSSTIDLLFKSAPLHDIGKVGIPDNILLKPGPLTVEEFEIMKRHTVLGREAIRMAELRLGKSIPFMHFAKEIAYSHQEKWDGSGYPQGLSGDAIPISARLMAVADVYDALISQRVYKPALPHVRAVEIISNGSATHFDPDVVVAFLQVQEGCKSIASRYTDLTDAPQSAALA
jgi:putative two-component system response regulator